MGAVIVEPTLELLGQVLGLPAGVRVTGVESFDSIRRTVRIRVDGPELPACAEGATPITVDLQKIEEAVGAWAEVEVEGIALREGVEYLGFGPLPSRV